MIFSAQNIFSDAQQLAGTSAVPSTNVIDLLAPGPRPLDAPADMVKDFGKGNPVMIRIQLVAAPTGTTPTLDVVLQGSNAENFSGAVTLAQAPQLAGGAAGSVINLTWVPHGTVQRYIRLLYTQGGTSPVYQLTAGIVPALQTNTVPGA